MDMQIERPEQYDRFLDAVKLSLILMRQSGTKDFAEIGRKLGLSERTARSRFNDPGTLTLSELYAWCELSGKDPAALLTQAFSETKKLNN